MESNSWTTLWDHTRHMYQVCVISLKIVTSRDLTCQNDVSCRQWQQAQKPARKDSCGCTMRLTPLQAAPATAETYLSRSRGARLGCSLRLLCIPPEGRTGQISSLPLVHQLCITCVR